VAKAPSWKDLLVLSRSSASPLALPKAYGKTTEHQGKRCSAAEAEHIHVP
jgi:hypothetical protein